MLLFMKNIYFSGFIISKTNSGPSKFIKITTKISLKV